MKHNSRAVVKSKKLFVGDLSKFCMEQDLVNLFCSFGLLQEISIKRSSENGAALSYGFVTFSNEVEATNALRHLNGTLFFGRKLRIRWAAQNAENQGKARSEAVINSVYVRFHTKEINYYVTEEDLHSAFDPFGNVTDITIKESNIDPSTVTQSGYGFVHFTSDYHGIQSALRAVGGLDNKVVEGITYSVEPSKNLLKQFESMPGYKDPALATMGMPTLRTGATANYNQRNELNLNAPVYNPSQHNYQQPQMGQMHERMAPPLYMPAMMQSSLGGTRSGATTPPIYYPRRSENIQQSRPRIDDLLGLNDPYQRKSVGQFNTAKSASVTRCVSPVNDMYNHYSKSAGNTPRIPMHWDNDLNGPPGLPTQSRSLIQPQSGSYAAHRLEGDCSQYKSSQSYSSRSLADWSLASGHSNNMMANDFGLVRVSPPVPQLHLPASQDDFFYESVNAGYIAALPPLSRTGSHSDLSQLTTNSNNLEDIAFEKLDKQGLLGNTATNSINSGFTSLEGDRSTGMNGSTTLSSLDAYSMNCSLNKFNAIDQERAPVEDIYGSLDACY